MCTYLLFIQIPHQPAVPIRALACGTSSIDLWLVSFFPLPLSLSLPGPPSLSLFSFTCKDLLVLRGDAAYSTQTPSFSNPSLYSPWLPTPFLLSAHEKKFNGYDKMAVLLRYLLTSVLPVSISLLPPPAPFFPPALSPLIFFLSFSFILLIFASVTLSRWFTCWTASSSAPRPCCTQEGSSISMRSMASSIL